jgi:hypothetical protein
VTVKERLEASVVRSDAVLSALGTRAMKQPTTIYSQETETIVTAMITAGISRLIVLSAIPLIPPDHRSLMERHLVHPMLYRYFGGGYEDIRNMELLLEGTNIDWTVFRPTRLTNRQKTGKV